MEWDDKSENAFHQLKTALMTATTEGLPLQDKFQLWNFNYEKGKLALGMVAQLQASLPSQ
jgi:hypothetical protein